MVSAGHLEVAKDLAFAASVGLMLIAGASFVSANNMLDNVRTAAHQALELLQDEIVRQTPVFPQSTPSVFIPGVTPADPEPEVESQPLPAHVVRATGHLRNATELWTATARWPPSEEHFKALDKELAAGFDALGLESATKLVDMLPGYLPFPKAPAVSVGWAVASAGAGVAGAIFDGWGKAKSEEDEERRARKR